MLPTMKIGDHAITRLIAGSNPFTGKSHMTPEVDADMKSYFTDEQAFAMLRRCEEAGINAMVSNMATVKPLDEALVLEAAKKCGKIVTAEEHSVIGGLGEAVAAVLSEKLPTPIKRVGVQDVFGQSGPAAEVLKYYGLCAENIVNVAKSML